MAANNEWSDLEHDVFEFIRCPGSASHLDVLTNIRGLRSEVLQAIASLVSNNYIIGGTEQPIRYSVVLLKEQQ